MYVSMTGFSAARTEREWGIISLELSSVNHRYQEVYVRLPKELSGWEPWFHSKLRTLFRRGKVQARIEIRRASSLLSVSINRDLLLRYSREIADVSGLLGDIRSVSLDALLNLPGVLDGQDIESLAGDDMEGLLTELLERCAGEWEQMRRKEGLHLKEAVEGHLAELEGFVSDISGRWEGCRDAAFALMKERVAKALSCEGTTPPEDSRFAQEAVIIADRWDIREELDRLASHFARFRETGDMKEPAGRKLDFLMQEINREINTVSSKVQDADIRWLAVEAKTSAERIREQIQNLE